MQSIEAVAPVPAYCCFDQRGCYQSRAQVVLLHLAVYCMHEVLVYYTVLALTRACKHLRSDYPSQNKWQSNTTATYNKTTLVHDATADTMSTVHYAL
eukprot:14172-Heterococcus_DN1.PRE.2